jgi:metallo-beta-lactamase class B
MKSTMRVSTGLAACLATVFMFKVSVHGQGRAQGAAAAPDHKEELSETYRGSKARDIEYQKIAPFKVMDDLFYVGPGFVSAWIIPTTQGLIMIDTAQEPYVDTEIENIRKVGFDPKDIKYILLSHGHLDHFGGANKIQKLSGAKVALSGIDCDFMAKGAAARPPKAGDEPPACDMRLKEGDTIKLGKTEIKVYIMPGHTPGSTTYEFTTHENGKGYKTLVMGGPGGAANLEGAQQFLETANRLNKFLDVQVAANVHSWLNGYHYPNGGLLERRDKLAAQKPGEPNPFIDNASWRQWVKMAQDGAKQALADEQKKAATAKTQ